MDNEKIERAKEKWFKLNEPTGKKLGYPDCCIKAFGDNAPETMESTPPTEDDILRYNMGCIDGDFSGLIPCLEHAKEIERGEITLFDLINNRNTQLPPFPLA